MTEAAEALATFGVAVTAGLRAAPVIGVDETSVRSKKKRLWVHVARTKLLTLLYVHEKGRSFDAIEAGPLTGYTGVVIHDRYSPYFSFIECGAGQPTIPTSPNSRSTRELPEQSAEDRQSPSSPPQP